MLKCDNNRVFDPSNIGLTEEELENTLQSLHEKGFISRKVINGEVHYQLTSLGEIYLHMDDIYGQKPVC